MSKKLIHIAIIFSFLVIVPLSGTIESRAENSDLYDNSGLPIPRFVSLRSDKVFVRTGPALRYPIKWVFQKAHLPVEIVQEFDTWRQIRDVDGEEGWIHQSLLSGKRYTIVKGEENIPLRRKPVNTSDVLALIEPTVLIELLGCSGAWCAGKVQSYKGYIERKSLWGIYEDEELD